MPATAVAVAGSLAAALAGAFAGARSDERVLRGEDGGVRYGISLPPMGPFGDPNELAELAVTAERAGWDGFFIWDHMMFDPSFHPLVDPWVGLAAVALRTTRLTIGTMITPVARRRPWKLARETVSLDRLSGGRLVLGVGLGDPVQWDFGFFGEETDARVRAAKLDEGLDVLAGLWTGQPFSYEGVHFSLAEVTFRPTPLQRPRIPVWVGGWWPNKPPLRRAARWDGMAPIFWGRELTPEEVGEAVAYVNEHRAPHRAADRFDVVASGTTTPAPADREKLQAFADVGVTWWMEDVSPWRFGADPEAQWTESDTVAMQQRVAAGPPSYGLQT